MDRVELLIQTVETSEYTECQAFSPSSRPNWHLLPPHPQESVAPPPSFDFQRGVDTLACGWGGGGRSQFGRRERHSTLVLYRYSIIPLR